ncbi:MAG: tRNA (guanosine(46)-N7)-methyltransferase TrmB, partial [Ferruginibacter sp.]
TKTVINLYGLKIIRDFADVHSATYEPELMITTHYESLDIAKSRKIFYLRFSLPALLPFNDAELNNVLNDKRADAGG